MTDPTRSRRFEEVVMAHMDQAHNLARWLIRDPNDAEDALQEAMLRAYKFLDSCRPGPSRPWVLRIVRNACFDWLGARGAVATVGFGDLDPDDDDGAHFSEDAFTAPAADPETLLATKELRAEVDAMIADLPPEFREVVVLRELEDLSYKDIAEIVGIPLGTVMSRLSRARRLLLLDWTRRHGRIDL